MNTWQNYGFLRERENGHKIPPPPKHLGLGINKQ